MDANDARCYLNYLLTLSIRKEEAFGPLAFTFIKSETFENSCLLPDEKFTLLMATIQAFTNEPKRYTQKLDVLKKALHLLGQSNYSDARLSQTLEFEIRKTETELEIYNSAMRAPCRHEFDQQRLIVQSEAPHYFLDLAQKRAAAYYRDKFTLSREAKAAQHFGGKGRKFEPKNQDVHREFPGACGPFMNSRVNAFHLLLPFDLKISRQPDDPLDAGVRIFYSKNGYSFPLTCEMDRLCSYYDGEVLEIPMDDPNLLFISVSRVKDREFRCPYAGTEPGVPADAVYPRQVLERSGCLGVFFQIVTNFKVWFDSTIVSVLVQGAPDLHEYGLLGGAGLLTRTHASDKVPAYAESIREPWQDGLSFNFVNMHVQLAPGVDTAFVPYNTPIFTLYPVLSKPCYRIEESQDAERAWQAEHLPPRK